MRSGSRHLLLVLCICCVLCGFAHPRYAAAQQGASPAVASLRPVMVHLDLPPLGLVGRAMSADQRRAYGLAITAAQNSAEQQVAALGGSVVRRFRFITSGLLAELPLGATPQLAAVPHVLRISPVADYQLSQQPLQPGAPAPARAMADLGLDGSGTTIAFVDSGIDYTHLAFGGPGTVAAYQDAYATNTTIGDSLYFPGQRVRGGYDYVGEAWPDGPVAPDPDPIDAQGHGTAVADIAAGSEPATPGLAPAADLYALKACSARSRLCNGPALLQAIEDALDLDRDLATIDPATVIVLALSSAYGQPEDDLSYYVDIASEYGAIVVTSAGNNGDKPYIVGAPSTAVGAISVGQTQLLTGTQQPLIGAESSRGPRLYDGAIKPDLLATSGTTAAQVGTGNGRVPFRGSSSSAPLVAGAAALLAQKFGAALTPAGYRALLMNSANPAVVVPGVARAAESAAVALRGDGINAVLGSSVFARAPRLAVRCADGSLNVLDPLADTFVEAARPRTAYGELNYLRARDPRKASGEMLSLLRFPAPACTAASAELQLDISKYYPPTGGRLLAFATSSSWNEQTTWRNRPPIGTPGGAVTVNEIGYYSLDVSALVGSGPINLALRGDGRLSVEFKSREVNAPARLLVSCSVGGEQLLDLTADTFVRQDRPTVPQGNLTILRVHDDALAERITLLRFPAPACSPLGARLEFQVPRLLDDGGRIEATRIVGSWDETTTWLTRPELGDQLGAVAVAAPGIYRLDVGDIFGGQVAVLAPITRQGAGQLDVAAALATETIAWQEQPGAGPTPAYSQTASLSFGFTAVSTQTVLSRTVSVRNLSTSPRSYTLRSDFRYADDADAGVTISVAPSTLLVPANGQASFSVTLTINAAGLRPWTLDSGALGARGSDFGDGTGPLSPSLTLFEYDGFITVDGGVRNMVRLPWQVLPRRSADVVPLTTTLTVPPGSTGALTLTNRASATAGDVEAFALMEISPNIYSYTVGSLRGQNYTLIDLNEIGVRGRTPADGSGTLVEFAATVHDYPYRAAQYPVQIAVLIDANRDGVDDFQVFTDDAARNASDGRNAVFVRSLPAGTPRLVGFVDRDFNSQNWIVPVPAQDIGVGLGQPFSFQMLVLDNAFPSRSGEIYLDLSSRLTYQLDAPAMVPALLSGQVPAAGSAVLSFSVSAAGLVASPSQQGLLLLHRRAPVGRESDAILIASE